MRLLMVHFTINRIKVVVTSSCPKIHGAQGKPSISTANTAFSPFVVQVSSPSFKDNHLLGNLLLLAKVRFLIQAAKRKKGFVTLETVHFFTKRIKNESECSFKAPFIKFHLSFRSDFFYKHGMLFNQPIALR